MKRKQLFAMGMALSLTVSLAGCGKGNDAGSTDAKSKEMGSTEAKTTESDGTGAKAEDNVLVVAMQTNGMVTDYEDNYLTHYLEDKLGIDIQFYMLPTAGDEVRTKVSLMATSGEGQPDVLIVDGALPSETILQYGSNGFLLPLNQYLEDASKMPNYNAISAEDKAIIETGSTQADGNIYSLSRYNPETWNKTPNRIFINKTWLDTLGLSEPTTIDELKTVLQAFRDGDPNGNGIQDEIGVYGFSGGGYGENTIDALMNSFIFWIGGLSLDESGKQVIAPYTTEQFKAGLTYMNDLYNEGLLSADIFTVDGTQFKATLNQEVPVVGMTSAGSLSNWTDAKTNANFLQMELIAPLAGPEGVSYSPYYEHYGDQILFIPAGCKNIDLALKFADEFLDPYTSIITRYGEEGVDWTKDEAVLSQNTNAYVEEGLYDKLTLGVISKFWYENQNKTWRNVNPRYYGASLANTFADLTKGTYDPESPVELDAKNYRLYNSKHPENILPPLHYTVDEATAIQDALSNIPSYMRQSMAEFITGVRDINKDWDTYLNELDSMGLQQWLSTAQSAYDRAVAK